VSLFGWREKRRIEDLEDRLQQHRDRIGKLEEANGDLTALAEGRKAALTLAATERDRYRRDAADLGRMLTREVAEAVEDVAAAQAVAARYRLAWKSARRWAVRRKTELDAQYRVVDFLGQQLLDSVSGQDPRLKALADAVKDSEVTA
jgi:ATP-dependent Clp protease ATP-binding subunit ClpA